MAIYYCGGGFDDAHERADLGVFSNNNASVFVIDHTSTYSYHAGFRFRNVAIAQGATITSAAFRGYIYDTATDDINCTIYGNDVDDADDFNDNQNIKTEAQRPRTTASVAWVENALGIGWAEKTGLESIIQEIVDRGTWVSGNDIVLLFIVPEASSFKGAYFYSYDQDSSYAAQLDVTVEAGGGQQILTLRTQMEY